MSDMIYFRDGDNMRAVSKDNPLPVTGGGGGSSGGSTAANQTAALERLGELSAAAVTDPAVAAGIIPLLKGMLTLLATIAANTAPTP